MALHSKAFYARRVLLWRWLTAWLRRLFGEAEIERDDSAPEAVETVASADLPTLVNVVEGFAAQRVRVVIWGVAYGRRRFRISPGNKIEWLGAVDSE